MVEGTMDPLVWLRKQLEEADVDLLREMVSTFVQALLSAEADALCGASYGDRRAEQAVVQVVAECYLKGVSTRRVDALVKALGIEGISKSHVSELSKTLDEQVRSFRTRPLDQGPYTYLWLDALEIRCREAGRIVNVASVIATAVNTDGRREILGLDLHTTEDGAGWTAFLRDLVARGLSGVQLVISDDHRGLTGAIAAVLQGASWQRSSVNMPFGGRVPLVISAVGMRTLAA